MKKFLRSLSAIPNLEQIDPRLQRSCLGRVANSLTFLFIVLALGLWLTFFVLYRDSLQGGPGESAPLDAAACLLFFGGLTLAMVVASLGGNLLRRALWRFLLRQGQRHRHKDSRP
ncbi:MAG: hypothetical protein ABWK53_08285 [Anaerolineales bacterium]